VTIPAKGTGNSVFSTDENEAGLQDRLKKLNGYYPSKLAVWDAMVLADEQKYK